MPHNEFLDLLKQMTASMQCSYSESFNIVAADSVVNGVPVVTSPAISWVNRLCQADPNATEDMVSKLRFICNPIVSLVVNWLNLQGLKNYCRTSKNLWLNFLK